MSSATVVISFLSNFAEAIAKLAAAWITGSAALSAEAIHTFADTGDAVLLMVAERESGPPPDDSHPYGYGRSIYTWSLLAALGMFTVGGAVSIMTGLQALGSPRTGENYTLGYIVLAISFVLNVIPFIKAAAEVRRCGDRQELSFLAYLDQTSQSALRAVFAEGVTGTIGVMLAAMGMILHELTGNVAWDAAASITIGVMLCCVAIHLVSRNGQFLLGRAAPARLRDELLTEMLQSPEVQKVTFFYTEYVGADKIAVIGAVAFRGQLTQQELSLRFRSIEKLMMKHPEVVRVVFTLASPAIQGLSPGESTR